ncbi:MAG: tetratricopeptide repeat protein [Myxococcota bacterium]
MVLALHAVGAGSVRAQEAREGGEEPAVGQGSDEEARALFMAGRVAYDERRYEDALEYFQRSYELSGRPELLFNVGQTLDRLRRDREAVKALRRYLEEVPDASNRQQVEARIRALEQAIQRRQAQEGEVPSPREAAETSAPASSSPEAATTEADDGGVHTEWWFWTTIGGGVVTAVLLGVLLSRDDTQAPFEGPDGVHEVLREAP